MKKKFKKKKRGKILVLVNCIYVHIGIQIFYFSGSFQKLIWFTSIYNTCLHFLVHVRDSIRLGSKLLFARIHIHVHVQYSTYIM